jgi:hypothetical protein
VETRQETEKKSEASTHHASTHMGQLTHTRHGQGGARSPMTQHEGHNRIVAQGHSTTGAAINSCTKHRHSQLTDGRIHFSFVYFSLILMCSRRCEADFHVLEGV